MAKKVKRSKGLGKSRPKPKVKRGARLTGGHRAKGSGKRGPDKKPRKLRPARPLKGAKKAQETIRRKKISKALKAFQRKRKAAKVFLEGDTKADKAWGKKLAAEAERAKKEARKKPPRVKSKVHVPSELPEGFTDVAKDKIERVEGALEDALTILSSAATQEALGIKFPLNADVRAHANADGSFDSELVIRNIPRGLTLRDLSIYVEGLIRPIPGTFVSIGFRSSHSDEYTKENYNRVRGKVQVQTHFHGMNKKAIAFTHAREIDATLIDRKYHKPEDFLVRIHWNPFHIKPKRKPGR